MCTVRMTACAPLGYELAGSCGERLVIGPSEILVESRLPENACAAFRAAVLGAFGRDGPRRLGPLEEPYDGMPALGRGDGRPLQGSMDEELAALFERVSARV